MSRLLGFSPDVEDRTEGAILDCSNIIPTRKGFSSVRELSSLGSHPLPQAPKGLGCITTSLGRNIYAATSDRIYKYAEPSWVIASRPAYYVTSPKWMFTSFGDVAISASGLNKIQCYPNSTGGQFFDDIPEAPKAHIAVVSNGFVLAFNMDDHQDGWACSALYDHLTWAPSASKQSANGRLIDSLGEITSALPLGNGVAVYKRNAVYLATYIGAPSQNVIWGFERISAEAGALSSTSVTDIGGKHFIIGPDDFWIFDGSRPYRLNAPVKEWFFSRLKKIKDDDIVCFFDETTRSVYISFCDKTVSDINNTTLVYHIDTQAWGKIDFGAEVCGSFFDPGIIYDNLGMVFDAYEKMRVDSFNKISFSENYSSPRFFNSENILCDMSGIPLESRIETWIMGDYSSFSRCLRVIPEFIIAPNHSSLEHLYARHPTEPFNIFNKTNLFNGIFYTNLSSRWHKFRLKTSGMFEITGLEFDYKFTGKN